jgi:hypothetical protein
MDRHRMLPVAPEIDEGAAQFDALHPVRLSLVLEIVDLLQRHGYQRIAEGRSFAAFLRHLNALVKSYEKGC